MFFRLGFSEVLIISLICLLAFGFPAVVLAFLSKLSNRVKNIEDKLKDKS